MPWYSCRHIIHSFPSHQERRSILHGPCQKERKKKEAAIDKQKARGEYKTKDTCRNTDRVCVRLSRPRIM